MDQSTAIAQHFVVDGRDLRLDFLRGLVMLVVICVHLEYLSILSVFMWNKIGLVSSAEGFVFLSGVVLGIVYKKKLIKEGFRGAAIKLLQRAWKLYLVNIFVISSILILSAIPLVNVHVLTYWIPITGGGGFNLFNIAEDSWPIVLKKTLLLEIGPHQFQIMGLYTTLLALSPLALYALSKQKTHWLLACSWLIYFINYIGHFRLTFGNYEYAFPTLSWQVLFYSGMVVGYHHQVVFDFLTSIQNSLLRYFLIIVALAFMFLALSNPDPHFWPWHSSWYHDKEAYRQMINVWFSKEKLGLGRLLNNSVLYALIFGFITQHWQVSYRCFGWLLVPIGQASLYVFIWHLYLVLLFSNTSLPQQHNIWINTGIHLCSIATIWLMVKKRFLFAIVPR